MRILVYHSVNEDKFSLSPRISPTNFHRQMLYLKKYYNIFPLEKALPLLERRSLPPRSLSITFDDGYRDVFWHAYPVLKALSIPATIFLSSHLINTKGISWTEKINQALKKSSLEEIEITMGEKKKYRIGTWKEKKEFAENIEREILKFPPSKRKQIVNEIIKQTGEPERERIMLSWQEVKEMKESGLLRFGSHSATHEVLSQLSERDLEREIKESKEVIENRLGERIEIFSYPSADFNDKVKEKVKSAGYQYALDVKGEKNYPDFDHFAIKRIHIEDSPLWVFAAEVQGILQFLRRRIVQ